MKEVTCNVTCPVNPEHKFQATYKVEDDSQGIVDYADEFCPFCGAMVRVKVEGKLIHDAEVHRKFGFDKE